MTEEIAAEPSARVDFSLVGPGEFKGIDRAVTIHQGYGRRSGTARSDISRRLTDGGIGRPGQGTRRSHLPPGPASRRPGRNDPHRGPCGIGKSRLLKDFVEQAELLGTSIITSLGRRDRPGNRLLRLETGAASVVRWNGIDAEEKLLEFVANDPWLDERRGLLATMVSVGVQDSDLIAGMEPELRGENTLRLLTEIVRGAPRASGPFVIVIDDGHWVDSASWAMAERAVREIPALAARRRHPPIRRGIRDETRPWSTSVSSRTSTPSTSSSPSWSRPR